ncbi:hypothetical protein H072_8963 [Dactylellina haptotyla CBS 200.50]|uniref:phospholipase D n=1 Tax=Dactylellina haptotyla (strain CBS 200.50) TaxID=1284197 RepID=S8BDS2_DACHA|nr:hypothetical protein H072_8963 [Dactylellina haptotyla CBS 200.50]
MGRSRSRSRDRSSSGKTRHKSKDDDYEGETKEERRARRHQKRREEEGKEESSEYASRGGYDKTETGYGSVPGGFDYEQPAPYGGSAAPYPESPEETHAPYDRSGGEYPPSSYPADSYASSQYAATGEAGYPAQAPQEYGAHVPGSEYGPATYQEYSGHTQSHDYSQSTQSYGAQDSSGYYQQQHTSPPPAGQYGPPTEPYGGTGQYGDPSYAGAGYAAPQPPYPTEYGEDATRASSQGYYGGTPGHDYQGGAYSAPAGGYNEVPRNPSTHNYNPRPEPSGAPPEAEPSFELTAPAVTIEEKWQPTAAPEKEKLSIFRSFRTGLHNAVRDLTNTNKLQAHSGVHENGICSDPDHFHSDNRFESFASVYPGNSIKWFVDGKDYCWAVADALSKARESIWILDWWLSPELHLRRPAAKYEEYRLDRMLEAAAKRGVKVNIIVYKEVTQALTLSSAHTKHYLEGLHPNIAVFRHPDHTPDGKVVLSKIISGDLISTFSGLTNTDQLVLYWAHHEKLCLIDGTIPGQGLAFMGGLDLCWGRWDLPHHPISDVHPTDIKETIFLGQDYNNARVMDFHTVDQWTQNKLKRTESSRMGWSDVALCLTGPTVDDLKTHFMERWNFICESKYSKKDTRYTMLNVPVHQGGPHGHGTLSSAADKLKRLSGFMGGFSHGQDRGVEERGYSERGFNDEQREERRDTGRRKKGKSDYDADLAWSDEDDKKERRKKKDRERDRGGDRGGDRGYGGDEGQTDRGGPQGFYGQQQQYQQQGQYQQQQGGGQYQQQHPQHPHHSHPHPINCQIVRSVSPWSHNTKTEHSIQNAYIQIISSAHHFIYIENQFFITATDGSRVVKNRVGEALVNRIIRAHQNNERFRVIVIMPSVPAFAGDLHDEGALGTRAIMEYQYDSITRGGKGSSIYEKLHAAGVNPKDYIRFFNLRNYDRINISRELESAEAKTKFEYEVVQQALENKIGAGYQTAQTQGGELNQWTNVQGGVGESVWDSVAQCSMLGGGDVRDAPWAGDPEKEIEAFVSEELYIHSKLLIADDRIAICGSANLNDRSQLGDHDSEIAIIIEDQTPLTSLMNGRQYIASHFAGTLRRYLFRKHLGLIPAQRADHVDANSFPVPEPNVYDFDSAEDKLVMDPLSDSFWNHWNNTAKTNTDAFARVFHAVPYEEVVNWEQYKDYYGKYFGPRGTKEKPEPPLYQNGHVVKENFPRGPEGARAVKEELAKVRGSLVEMPLKFMQDVDFAKEAASYNAFTEELYT